MQVFLVSKKKFTIPIEENCFLCKVKNILKGSLNLIPSTSPSVKIQIMEGKVCLECKGTTLLGVVTKWLIWIWKNPSFVFLKVEKKGSLDLIPSPTPSVKIQIMGGKFCLRCKGKTLLGVVNKLLKTKSCWHHPAMFVLFPQVIFPRFTARLVHRHTSI